MEKIDYKDLPDTSTPLSAENLNLMQTNIETAINGVVESGSNDNGSYIKYADGTLICYATKRLENVAVTTSINNGAMYRSEELQPFADFPVSFISTPSYSISVTSPGGYVTWVGKEYICGTTNLQSIRLFGTWSNTTSFDLSYIAIGRWK